MSADGTLDHLLGASLAAVVREQVPRALGRACEDAGDAYESFEYSDGFTYGTSRWRFGHGELADALLKEAGGQRRDAGHLRLTGIGADGRVLVYPVAVGNTVNDLQLESLKIRPSLNRRRLLGGTLLVLEPQLPFEWGDVRVGGGATGSAAITSVDDVVEGDAIEDQLVTDEQIREALESAGPDATVLLVAYASNPNSGLLGVLIGEATMDESGSLDYAWHEELALPVTPDGLVGVSDAQTSTVRTFTSGEEPVFGDLVRPVERRAVNGDSAIGQPAREGDIEDTDNVEGQ